MSNIDTRTKIIAGTPIEIGDRRFLPSILVTTVQADAEEGGLFHAMRLRPISVVEQGPEGNRWHAIPNTTQETLSIMVAIGVGVAVVSSLIILLKKLIRR
jgi:hypothetical protein